MTPLPRLVEPEWLDTLPIDDPRAEEGRKDLRRINALMGNASWILRQVAARPDAAGRGLVELGAGEGKLLAKLANFGPATGCDLAPRPPGLPEAIEWVEGDLLSDDESLTGGILVANLVLHHFQPEDLARIGRLANRFDCLILVEPHRSCGALALSALLLPFVAPITRHDMPVSVRAGFVPGELRKFLGLPPCWSVTEKVSRRGGLRVMAARLA